MKPKFKASAQGGFTLIELIVVIVILGILAATALPKFSNLSGDARKASLMAAKGAIATSSAVFHGKYLIDPTKYATTVPTEGNNTWVNMSFGYPKADATLAAGAGLSGEDYTITEVAAANSTAASLTISPKGVADATKCVVTYTGAASTSTPPTIVVSTNSDCN